MPRVLLTGFMGCGKSVIGERLAVHLSAEYIDLDERIVHMAGATIKQIFAEQGENTFRELESRALTSLPDHIVCALGGGTLMRSQNLIWALEKSWMIYLRVGVNELVRRLQEDRTVRPLLQDREGIPLSIEHLEMRVRSLLEQREPIYNQAHQALDVDGISPEAAAIKCCESYRRRNVWR